ncbi:MAG: hypothetical protein LIP28_09825 [Deltaproteobacteria bacterium]|nr:hypothetical protein [Deltaproteobacteria bacterium]
MYKSDDAWLSLALGCLLTGSSIYGLLYIEDGVVWRGVFVPIWTNYLLFSAGVVLIVLSLRAIRNGKGKKEGFTDEDARKAEAEMDALYCREHGEPPEKPKRETDVR